jgi:hypothetical protein
MKKLESIKKLSYKLLEKVIVGDSTYDEQDVINYVRSVDPTVVSIDQALNKIHRMRLYGELERVVKNNDKSLDYSIKK